MRVFSLCIAAIACLIVTPQAQWHIARPDYAWSFPRDHWPHEAFRTEWWYVAGIVASQRAPHRQFGYQFTLFRIGITPNPLTTTSNWQAQNVIMGHAALTDLATGEHCFAEVFYRDAPVLGHVGTFPDPVIAWTHAPPGSSGQWRIEHRNGGFWFTAQDDPQSIAFEFDVLPSKPLVFHGPNGFSRKSQSGTAASMYYSYTRMGTTGTLIMDNDTMDVSGVSWMDREFGSGSLADDQVGWDWFGLRLDDGRDLMLYVVRDTTGTTNFVQGTLVEAGGTPTNLTADEWSLQPRTTWKSGATGITYPVRWSLVVPAAGLNVEIAATHSSQENVSSLLRALVYWEGAVRIMDADGHIVGNGFAELTGYGGSRPPV